MKVLEVSIQKYLELKNLVGNTKILLASKGVDEKFIMEFIERTGHLYFAENYASELKKWVSIIQAFPQVEVSFIGSFQSGNLRNIVKTCKTVESVSSLKQLEKLKKESLKQQKDIKFYAQINIGKEEQKSGFLESEITPEFSQLFSGLMCIPPAKLNPEYYFKKMQSIGAELGIKTLSMGMSADFKKAIEFGATEIRIGNLIFGERKK
jgi:pyridoxal phosphate enzyme (YggS family)